MNIIKGTIHLPGDKSISHRSALFSAMRAGQSRFTNFNFNEDCTSTLSCLRKMGIEWQRDQNNLIITGKPLMEWNKPKQVLDAGNSGTTTRLLSAILANLSFATAISGDASLSKRPMKRIIDPLQQMGARISSQDGMLPMKFQPVPKLSAIRYKLPIASAQVKSATLLAGLFAEGITEVIELQQSRDHTERMLKLERQQNSDGTISIFSSEKNEIPDLSMAIPGDISSAAFFIVAALLLPGSELRIENVSLNPTRTGFLDVLLSMGAGIEVEKTAEFPEPVGNLMVRYSELSNITIRKDIVANIIDEVPILAILASRNRGIFRITDAEDLRYKESDRIHAIVENLKRTGISVEEFEDGFQLEGLQRFSGGDVKTFKDHRIAMSFAIAGLSCEEPILLDFPECVNVSFPDFWSILKTIVQRN